MRHDFPPNPTTALLLPSAQLHHTATARDVVLLLSLDVGVHRIGSHLVHATARASVVVALDALHGHIRPPLSPGALGLR